MQRHGGQQFRHGGRKLAAFVAVGLALLAAGSAPAARAAAGDISTFAGNGTSASSGDGGAATSASLISPIGVAYAPNGDVYVADYSANRIRKISPAGVISAVAGTGSAGFSGDGGQATAAQLDAPRDVAVDSAGNVFLTDSGNSRIRKINTSGVISTYAGTGTAGLSGDGGPATAAQLSSPRGVDLDSSGNLYFADYNNTVRKIAPNGTITRVAGTGVAGSSGDGGQATSATLSQPVDVVIDSAGNLYVSAFAGNRIRKVNTAGVMSTIAGTGSSTSSGDGGAATAAGLDQPAGLDVDANDNLYVSEYDGNVIRKISGGLITRVAGNRSAGFYGDGGSALSAQVNSPDGIVVTPTGDLLITDLANHRVRRVQAVGPPDAPTFSSTSPASPGRQTSVKVIGSAATGSTVQLYTDSGCSVPIGTAATAASFASPGVSVTVPADAATTFHATTTLGGLTSPCSRVGQTYVEDSTAPLPPTISSAPPSPGSSRTPSWSFTGEAGATFECELKAGTVVSPWSPCPSPRSYDLTGKADATYTFSVRATDLAGNRGAAQTSTYTLDTSLPAAPTISASPPATGNGLDPAWSFTGDPGATFECRVERSGTALYDWAACSSGQAFSLAAQPDDTYTFLVRARSTAGNVGPSTTGSYRLDRAAPAQPTVSGPASPARSSSPVWSFTGEAGATFECRLDRGATQIADWASCSGSQGYDLSALADGTYTFSVRATDAAGNVGAARTSDYAFDTTAPAPPTIGSAPASPGSATTPSWSFTTEPAATTECRLARGATVVSDWATCTSSRLYDLSSQPDGDYTFSVRATDAAGNQGAAQASLYSLDRVAPGAPSIDSSPATPGNDVTPAWSFSSEAGATFICRIARGATVVADWMACSSAKSYDLSSNPDGTYTFSVRATDAAGNMGPARTSDYVLDTAAPSTPTIVSSPVSPGNDPTPRWTFSGDSGATFACRVTRGGTVVSDWATCASPASYDLSSQPDGTYTFAVRASDAAGNIGTTATRDFTLDTTVPTTPSLDSAPGATGSGRSVAWSFSGDGAETFECKLASGSTTVSDWTTCTSPAAFDLTGQDDGAYTFSARGVSSGGTRGSAITDDYLLDTHAPDAPTIDTPPPATGSARNATWSFAAEAGAQVECRLDRGPTAIVGWSACTSPYAADLSGQPDGTYTLGLRATDAAGNTGTVSSSSYALDTTPPSAPAVDPPPSALSNNSQPRFTFPTAAGTTYECRLVGAQGASADWQPCTSPQTYDLSGQPDGSFAFELRATDQAGNTGAATSAPYQLDRAPASVQIDSAPGATGNSRGPGWSFSAEPGATFECSLASGATTLFGWAGCASPHAYDLGGQPDGSYTFSVRAIDQAGNVGGPVVERYSLDTTAPAKPALKSSPASPGADRTPSLSFAAETGSTIECRVQRKGTTVIDWNPCSSPKTFDLRGQADGTYRLLVRARDAAGNISSLASDDYVLDSTAPDPPAIDARPQSTASDFSPTWKFSGEDGAQFECTLTRGPDTVAKPAPCTSPKTYKLAGEPAGDYSFAVTATDAAGNTGRARVDTFTLVGAGANAPASGGPAPTSGTPAPTGAPFATPAPAAAPAGTPAHSAAAGGKPGKAGTKGKSGSAKPGAAPGVPAGPVAKPGGANGSAQASGAHAAAPGHHEPRHGAAAVAHLVGAAVGKAVQVVTKNADKSVFPFSLVLIVFAFLGIQGRIDRSDPKLALAPLTADPDLEFFSPPTLQ